MNLRLVPLVLLLLPAWAFAQKQQYINDEITVSLRDGPRNDATFLGLLKSGDAVTVLENLGEQSFARVRTADGREGWVTARFLSDEPAAASLLADARAGLDKALARIGILERELEQGRTQSKNAPPAQTPPPAGRPAPPAQSDAELVRQNTVLRAQIEDLQQRAQSAALKPSGQEQNPRELMFTGATLLGIGVILGMLLQWLAGRRRRHWSDF